MKKLLVLVVLIMAAGGLAYTQTTDFFELVQTGTPQSVKAAIGKGADVKARNEYGSTPLHHAAQYNQEPYGDHGSRKGRRGRQRAGQCRHDRADVRAAFNRNPEAITTLLKAGADLTAQDTNGMTALMWAARGNSNPEMITTLLKAGADGKAKDNLGRTAFKLAQNNRYLKGTDAYQQLQKVSQ